jgi:hypothetical protein
MACSLLLVSAGIAHVANAASAGQSVSKDGVSARNNVVEIKHGGRRPWPNLPIAPSYLAYDWPYEFTRGHYPTHIGPGYVYYGYPYSYRSGRYPAYGSGCSYWPAKSLRKAWTSARKCVGD